MLKLLIKLMGVVMNSLGFVSNICNLPYTTVKALTTINIGGRVMTDGELSHFFRAYNAHWVHSGTPEEPHPLLVSGKHGGEYFDCTFVLKNAQSVKILAHQLFLRLGDVIKETDWVIGPSYGATWLIARLADLYNCNNGVTEKVGEDQQAWTRDFINENCLILPCEDVTTTGGSSLRAMQAIKEGNAGPVNFLPIIATIVNRSGKEDIDGFKIISLIVPPSPKQWIPDDCPLCKIGSKVRPRFKKYLASLAV